MLLALLGGCSALLDVDGVQCLEEADCAALGLQGTCDRGVCISPEVDQDALTTAEACGGVACAGLHDPVCFADQCAPRDVVEPFACTPAQPGPEPSVRFGARVLEYTKPNQPLPGLTITACQLTDVTCSAPVASVQPVNETNEFEIDLPRGFDGYLKIETEVTMPFIWHFTQPPAASTEQSQVAADRQVMVLRYDSIESISRVINVPVNVEMGIIIVQAHDCDGLPRGGIHFEAQNGSGTPFYLADLLPNLDADTTIYDRARNLAVGGFFNAPTGFTLLTARIDVGGPVIASQNINVRGGAMTYLDVRR